MTSTLLQFRGTKTGRASAMDDEILELFARAPGYMSRMYHPLYVKMCSAYRSR